MWVIFVDVHHVERFPYAVGPFESMAKALEYMALRGWHTDQPEENVQIHQLQPPHSLENN